MKNRFKSSYSAVRQRDIVMFHVSRDNLMTGYLSNEIHKKLRELNKKRHHIH